MRVLTTLLVVFTAFVSVSTALGASDPLEKRSTAVTTYYVSTAGKDTNPGTALQPWRTVQHAANLATPGSVVYIRGGVYRERVDIHVSGNERAGYSTFQSYPGETATLDGSTLVVPGTDNGMFFIKDCQYIVIDGFQIQNYRTSDSGPFPIGIMVTGACNHIQILNNVIHHIETNAEASGGGANGISAYGTSASGPINNLVISGNTLYSLKTGSSECLVVNGNFRITKNLVHDTDNIGIVAIGYERTAPGPDIDRARDGIISQNTVYNITSKSNQNYHDLSADGIYVDGGTRIVVERNIVRSADIGIEVACETLGRLSDYVTVRDNLVYGSNTAGISIGGYDAQRGGTDHCTIANNTFYMNDTTLSGGGEFLIQYRTTNCLFTNNILVANNQGLFLSNNIQTPNGPGVSLDYNLYYSAVGDSNAGWLWNNSDFYGLAAFVRGTNNDIHSTFAYPKFVSPAKKDFHLASDSPGLGKGKMLDSSIIGLLDLNSNPRTRNGKVDIGCYERQ